MKRGVRISLPAVLLVVILGGAGAYLVYREFIGTESFNDRFYTQAATTTNAVFSYKGYAATLKNYVNEEGMVDYEGLKQDHKQLDDFLLLMAHLDRKTNRAWDDKAKIAFWINAYNALTLKVIINHYPIQAGVLKSLAYPKNSIRQIPGVWDKIQFLVMGKKMTLEHIEHRVLRKEFDEPRIHVALVCAAKGCPQLRNEPYIGERLNAQLDDQSKEFLTDPTKFRIDRDDGTVYLSSIFKWFGGDFVSKYAPEEGLGKHSKVEGAVLHYASKYLPKKQADYLRTGAFSIKYLDYDWSLNEQDG